MILRSATGVFLALVFCTAENNEPRWSRPDQDLRQGEWVPLSNERLNLEGRSLQSAIQNPHQQINHALLQSPPSSQFVNDYQPKQIFGSQSAPPRIALVHPQSLNPQSVLQSQIPSQQLLSQYLNQQIEQGNLPIFSRALLHAQPALAPAFIPQQVNYNLKPKFNQAADFQNSQYRLNGNDDAPERFHTKEEVKENSEKEQFSKPADQPIDDSPNKGSSLPEKDQKEEVQILYVPVEMLKQQEQARQTAKRIPQENENHSFSQNTGSIRASQETSPKESRKFRHPIQPFKDQAPAYHLTDTLVQGKYVSPQKTSNLNDDANHSQIKQSRVNAHNAHRASALTRNEPISKFNANDPELPPYSLKNEQLGDESNLQDEVSQFRNPKPTRRTPTREHSRGTPTTTLPPPNQPPLSVFLEKSSNNRVSDVLSLLKESKTIPVLDSVGPETPQVFVGPSNLDTPMGYIKYELPYLSSLGSNIGNKLAEVPIFVAPLNFQPPPGFAKIPFPPPHIGSVVLSNLSSFGSLEDRSIPTPPSFVQHTPDYKDSFTIPADISSISPQLPSLINSLQEENYAVASSTETLTETTEEPIQRHRRPTSSRRQNNRGFQRGTSYSSTTTRRPSARQRRPSSRYNQRNNQLTDSKEVTGDKTMDIQYNYDNNYYTTKSNRRPQYQEAISSETDQTNNRHETENQHNHESTQYNSNTSDEKQEYITPERQKDNYYSGKQTPNYNSEEISNPNDERGSLHHQQGRTDPSERTLEQSFQGSRYTGTPEYHRDTLHPPTSSGLTQNINADNYHLNRQNSQANPTENYDQNSYQSASQLIIPSDSPNYNGYDETGDRQNSKDQIQTLSNQNHQQDIKNQQRFLEQQRENLEENIPERTLGREQDFSSNEGQSQYQQSNEDLKTSSSPLPSYQDIQNDHVDEQTFRETTNQGQQSNSELTEKYQNHPSNAASFENSDVDNNYDNIQSQKRITERPIPVRTRTRFRGKTYNQVQQTQPSSSTNAYHYDEDSDKVTNFNNKYKYNPSQETPEDYVQGNPFSKTNENYQSNQNSDQTSAPPSRRLPHGRAGRRPLRPTASTTTTTTSTTTSPPPGKKYLIRTRRPTVAQTKLQSGRGRIRRPTTPTTTTTTTTQSPVTILTTEHPRNLPFQWRQPVEEDYSIKDDNDSPALSALEYQRESPQYQEIKTTEIQQSFKDDYPQHGKYHSHIRGESGRRVPSYSYDTEEETYPSQKQYEPTEANLRTNVVRTRRPHVTRDYETTRKPQVQSEYELTQKPFYSRDYETTQKHHYMREPEPTQRSYLSRDQETTQNVHYTREYEPTQRPYYSREYETTRKSHYTREYETSPKPQYSRDESSEGQQDYKNYESVQNPQQYHEPEQMQNSPQYEEPLGTNKPAYTYATETTRKAQNYRDYTTTRSIPAYQETETTPNPYISNDEIPLKTHSASTSNRNIQHSHRRRPISTNKEEIKSPKYQQTELPKDASSDFWNQAVTIQQSQSYVYTPDGNLSPTDEHSSSDGNTKLSSLPSDYDDYYNFQEGGHYTSDQSPFPSNDQHVTYTKYKAIQEVGKASQYPEKNTFEKSLEDEIVSEDIITQQQEEINENTKQPETEMENLKLNSEKETTKEQQSVPLVEQEPLFQPEHLYKEPVSPAKTGRRRGTWVRVRVKRPKDLFETAESQRFSSVRENALIPDESYPKVVGDKQSTQKPETNKTESSVVETLPTQTDVTVPNSDAKETPNEGITDSIDGKNTEVSTTSDSTQTPDNAYTTITNTEAGTQPQPVEDTTTVSSTIIPQEHDTLQSNPENFRTSTTTEISLETEICYKGQCIKTKRRKNDSNWGIQLTE